MSNVKNSIAEGCATGPVTVSATIAVTGAVNAWNPTFLSAYGVTLGSDIPVTFISGDDWQTCNVSWDGTDTLTIDSIQSTFVSGVYDDSAPTGITLSGIPSVQVTSNASEHLSIVAHDNLDQGLTDERQIIDGLMLEKPSMTIINDGGLQLDVDALVGGDIHLPFGSNDLTLDCTTGAGAGGKARVALNAGADANNPVLSWIYLVDSGDHINATLTASTVKPTGQFAWIGKILVPDAITWVTTGAYGFQRFTDTYLNDSRGALSHERERIRVAGAAYISGVVSTLVIDTVPDPDTVQLSTTAGEVYQMHRQAFPAFTTGPYYYGNGLLPYTSVVGLHNILTLQDGTPIINNGRYNLIIWGSVNISTGECKRFVNRPSAVYGSDAEALADSNATSDYSVPEGMFTTAFMICRIALSYKSANGGEFTELGTFSLLGTPVGIRAGGVSQAPASSEFGDATFRIFDDTDNSKLIDFQASGIATATKRTITMPDENVDLGAKIEATDYATSSVGGTLKARVSGAVLYLTNDGTDA